MTVVDSRILRDAKDYGYLVSTSSDEETALTVDTAEYALSCAGTVNSMADGYGDGDLAATSYKYVTALVKTDTFDPAPESMVFYVKLENDVDYIYTPVVSLGAGIESAPVMDEAGDNGELRGEAGLKPKFTGRSVLLTGEIGLNFYVTVPEDFDAADAKIVMTVNGKETETAWADGKDAGTNQKYFTCPLNSLEMGDTVTAVFSWGGGEGITNTYSVNEYVEYITGHADDFSDNAANLAESIADYGHYIAPFVRTFGKPDGLEHVGIAAQNEMTDEEISRVRTAAADFALTKDLGTSGVAVSYTLNLETKTSVYLYLKADEGVTVESAAVDGKNAALKTVTMGGETYKQIRITNISADKLAKTYDVTVTTCSGTAQITVSGLSYVNTILNSGSFNADAQKAMVAFYRYYEAAAAYKSNPKD